MLALLFIHEHDNVGKIILLLILTYAATLMTREQSLVAYVEATAQLLAHPSQTNRIHAEGNCLSSELPAWRCSLSI